MGILNKAFKFVDKAIEKVGTNIGEFINDVTGVTSSAKKQFEYESQLQQNAQNYTTWQMQNAHQIETEDLKKAGINPVATGSGSGAGGSVSPGATGSGTAGGDPISAITNLINTVNNSAKTTADIENQTKITDAEVKKMAVETLNAGTKTTQMVNDENFAKTWWGRNISPALRDIFGGGGGAVAAGATAGVAGAKMTSAKKNAQKQIINIHKH